MGHLHCFQKQENFLAKLLLTRALLSPETLQYFLGNASQYGSAAEMCISKGTDTLEFLVTLLLLDVWSGYSLIGPLCFMLRYVP